MQGTILQTMNFVQSTRLDIEKNPLHETMLRPCHVTLWPYHEKCASYQNANLSLKFKIFRFQRLPKHDLTMNFKDFSMFLLNFLFLVSHTISTKFSFIIENISSALEYLILLRVYLQIPVTSTEPPRLAFAKSKWCIFKK